MLNIYYCKFNHVNLQFWLRIITTYETRMFCKSAIRTLDKFAEFLKVTTQLLTSNIFYTLI